MKKIICIFAVLGLLLSSCRKEVELAPSFRFKVGIVNDASLGEKNLSIELTSSFGEIEALHFESQWTFEVEEKEIKVGIIDKMGGYFERKSSINLNFLHFFNHLWIPIFCFKCQNTASNEFVVVGSCIFSFRNS